MENKNTFFFTKFKRQIKIINKKKITSTWYSYHRVEGIPKRVKENKMQQNGMNERKFLQHHVKHLQQKKKIRKKKNKV